MLKSHLKHLLGCLMLELAALCGVKVNRPRRRRSRKWKRRKAAILRWATLAGLAVCAVMFLAGAVKLVGYGVERLSAAMSSRQLRQMYYEAETAAPTETPEPISSTAPQVVVRFATDTPSAVPIPSPAPQGTAAPVTLRSFDYPNNPTHIINSRFKTIRQQNADIVGWLTINGLLDEAVVQRDNIYYMTHDYLCRENANGAIFLDQIIGLDKRPYTLILYGHNMKSGAMFGSLRNFENPSFYRANPFITFDSIYEEGRYVIFAAAMVSVEYADSHYLDISKLVSNNVQNRHSVLSMLCEKSVIQTGVTVNADDQVLLLVTCVGDDTERRVIAARRLRDHETEADVAYFIQKNATR